MCVISCFFLFQLKSDDREEKLLHFPLIYGKTFFAVKKRNKTCRDSIYCTLFTYNWKACLSREGHNPQILLDLHRTLRCKKFVTWNPNESHAIHFSFIPIKSSKNSFEITKAEPSLFLCISKLNSIRTYILCVVFPAYIK